MRFKFNFSILILLVFVIAVSTSERKFNRRRNLIKGHNNRNKNESNQLIGFVPVSSAKGDVYLVPQHAIQSIQKEYSTKIGYRDGTILVPDQVIEVTGENTENFNLINNDETNYVAENDNINNIDQNSILALIENPSSLGRQLIRRGNRRGGISRRRGGNGRRRIRRRYKHRGGNAGVGIRQYNGAVRRRRFRHRTNSNNRFPAIVANQGGRRRNVRRRFRGGQRRRVVVQAG